MYFAILRNATAKELAVHIGGALLASAALVVTVVLSGWQHHRDTAVDCNADYIYYDPEVCRNVSSLATVGGWSYWLAAIVTVMVVVLLAVLAIMGIVFLVFGKWLEIRNTYDEDRRVNHLLREDYLGVMMTIAAFCGVALMTAGAGTILAELF